MQVRISDDLILVGTAHVSPDSVKEVRETILKEKPAVVAVELDERRAKALRKEYDWEGKSLTTLLEGRNSFYFLSQALLAAFQRQLGKEFGAEPGSDMLEGMKVAKDAGAVVALVDRDITITLQKAWRQMRFREKLRLASLLFSLMVPPPKLSKKDQEELATRESEVKKMEAKAAAPGATQEEKDAYAKAKSELESLQRALGIAPTDLKEMMKEDAINAMMEEMRRVAPTVARVLISERDTYMARKILEARKKGKVVAVVGAGHLTGLRKELEKELSGEKMPSVAEL
ncbi:MAG TPA: TraB/GumN family protein, partial [Thermoplasmata archaeon]|nr:TraB/GumN family protein [Thermoplasmata archaeon]